MEDGSFSLLDAVPVTAVGEYSTEANHSQILEHIEDIENIMDLPDHVAFVFITYPEPGFALQKLISLEANYRNNPNGSDWRTLAVSPLLESFRDKPQGHAQQVLIETLFLLQQWKLLQLFEVQRSSVQIVSVDSFRLMLFKIVDALSLENVQYLAREMAKATGCGIQNYTFAEMHMLYWIQQGKLSEQNCTHLINSLKAINCANLTLHINENHHRNIQQPDHSLNESLPHTSLTLVVDKESYIMRKDAPVGLCIIVNQMIFEAPNDPELQERNRQRLPNRYGSDSDRDFLTQTFWIFGFEVEVKQNLNHVKLLNYMKEVSIRDLSTYSCLVICILSHGENGHIMASNSNPISIETIKSFFDGNGCPQLVGKPKIFFIQACQGTTPHESVGDIQEDGASRSIPVVTDFYTAFATMPGYVSYRSTLWGSIFVRALSQELIGRGHKEHLLDVMLRVNNSVSLWTTTNGCKKQMPVQHCALRHKVQFSRHKDGFINAVLDRLQMNIMGKIIKMASENLMLTDQTTSYALIRSWLSWMQQT